jgi:hypothetical protein
MSYDGYPSVKLKTDALRALFPGDDCILMGDAEDGGAMTTPALLDSFAMNPCHLNSDGQIMAYRRVIGTLADIEIEVLGTERER